jgi:hypothetical protein
MRTYLRTYIDALKAMAQGSHETGRVDHLVCPDRATQIRDGGLAPYLEGYVSNEIGSKGPELRVDLPGWEGVLDKLSRLKEEGEAQRKQWVLSTQTRLIESDVDIPEDRLEAYSHFPYVRKLCPDGYEIDPSLDIPEFQPMLGAFRDAIPRQLDRLLSLRRGQVERDRERQAREEEERRQDRLAKAEERTRQIQACSQWILKNPESVPDNLVRAASEGYDTRSALRSEWEKICEDIVDRSTPPTAKWWFDAWEIDLKEGAPSTLAYEVRDHVVSFLTEVLDEVPSPSIRAFHWAKGPNIVQGTDVILSGMRRCRCEQGSDWQAAWTLVFDNEFFGKIEFIMTWDFPVE